MSPSRKKPTLNAVHLAVMTGNLAEVCEAISQGADIDDLDREGRTPLFISAGDGNNEISAELIKSGARVNARDKNLETPLHFAAREYRVAVAKLLLEHGAQVDAQDSHGNTPLFRAVFDSNGRGEMITLLLSRKADRHLKNKHGVSPYDLARTITSDVKQFLRQVN